MRIAAGIIAVGLAGTSLYQMSPRETPTLDEIAERTRHAPTCVIEVLPGMTWNGLTGKLGVRGDARDAYTQAVREAQPQLWKPSAPLTAPPELKWGSAVRLPDPYSRCERFERPEKINYAGVQ